MSYSNKAVHEMTLDELRAEVLALRAIVESQPVVARWNGPGGYSTPFFQQSTYNPDYQQVPTICSRQWGSP